MQQFSADIIGIITSMSFSAAVGERLCDIDGNASTTPASTCWFCLKKTFIRFNQRRCTITLSANYELLHYYECKCPI